MNNDTKKLLPVYCLFHETPIKGKRTVVEITFLSKLSSSSQVSVTFPKLVPNVCVVPNSICISAVFENTNTKSWFKNNLGRLLCRDFQMRITSSTVYNNNLESLIMMYKDLWLPDERREDMSEYGIASENLRKLMSGDDSANTQVADDNSLFKAHGKRVKIKLGKVLKDQGLFVPHALNGNVEYIFMTPSVNEIMITQSGESVGDYALKETKLIYETIESSDAYSQAVTEYADTDFPFEDIDYIRPTNWGKDRTNVVEAINISRRSMRAIVVLFKYKDTVDSEEYIFPNIKRVDVTIDRRPNAVYSNGIKTNDLYREARRVFHVEGTNMTEKKFYNNKFESCH